MAPNPKTKTKCNKAWKSVDQTQDFAATRPAQAASMRPFLMLQAPKPCTPQARPHPTPPLECEFLCKEHQHQQESAPGGKRKEKEGQE